MILKQGKEKKRKSIKQKMLSYILIPITFIFIAAFTFVLFDFHSIIKNNTEEFIQSQANSISVKIQNELNFFIDFNRFLKQNFESFENIPMENRRSELSSLMHDLLSKNPKFLSIWSIWELNSIDSLENKYANKPGSTVLGNFRYLFYRQGGKIKLSDHVEQNPNEVFNGKLYNAAKTKKNEIVVTHFYLDYNQTANAQVLQTNIVMPLYHNKDFLGVVGIDMELKSIQKIIQNIKYIENSEVYLFANNGMCISSPYKEQHGEQIENIFPDENLSFGLSTKIKKGQQDHFYTKKTNEKYYYTYLPISIGKTNTPWSILIKLPYSHIRNQTSQSIQLAIWGALIGSLLILVILLYISDTISEPLIKLRQQMDLVAQGETNGTYVPSEKASSEIQDISRSYNCITTTLQNSSHFAESIKQGNLNLDYKLLGEKDQLGKALIEMRDQLKISVQEQLDRQEEERKRYWLSDGLAKLNEILRKHDNADEFTFKILSYLINYVEANQGGVFIINNDNENNKILELRSFYAFNRRKYIKKTFELGEGLVGNCALEKQTIHLTEIPDNYIQITSGMGGSNPHSLLLIPMKIEEEVLGVIEIASFYKFEQYQIDFIEQAALNVASSLNMAETNKRTTELLERTQQQAEEMSAQEEEMRQNMEELQATQEESARRIEESEKHIAELLELNNKLKRKCNPNLES